MRKKHFGLLLVIVPAVLLLIPFLLKVEAQSINPLELAEATDHEQSATLNTKSLPAPGSMPATLITNTITQPTQLVSDTLSSDGTVLPAGWTPRKTTALHTVPTDTHPFTFVTVTLVVKDMTGSLIQNAEVKAFSEDYGIRYPDSWFATTDADGSYAFRVPVGRWSFFASTGWNYINSHPGQGLFVVLSDLVITTSTTLIAQPESTLHITAYDLTNAPLNGLVRMMDNNHVPIVLAPTVGKTQDGHIAVQVTDGITFDFLLFTEDYVEPGYVFYEQNMPAGGAITLQPALATMTHLIPQAQDRMGNPYQGRVDINYNAFNVGENTGLAPVGYSVSGQRDLYVTPGSVRITPYLTPTGWHYSFVGQDYDLIGGTSLSLLFGGPLTVDVRTLQPGSQIWLQVRDPYDNLMVNFTDSTGDAHVPITLTQESSVIFQADIADIVGSWNALVAGKLEQTYDSANSPDYQIHLNLGPMGVFNLTGTLLAPETLLQYEDFSTPHFLIHAPQGFHDRFQTMVDRFEAGYAAESAAIGEGIVGVTEITFVINQCAAGCAWTNGISMGIGFSLDSSYNIIPSTFLGVAWHELGHVFQLSPPLGNYYAQGWFGEPFATLMGNEAIGAVFGSQLQLLDQGFHDDFFEYIQNPYPIGNDWELVENTQFILFYLRHLYGMQIHRDFVYLWADPAAPSYRNQLSDAGFNTKEAIITLYSCMADQNLAWLFQLGGFEVTEAKVDQGLSLTGCICSLFDLDRDRDVDASDIMLIAAQWRMTNTDPNWDPRYDMDNNNVINVVDVMMVAAHWDERCFEPRLLQEE